MLNTRKFDFLVIGAGIVGLSVANELTEQYPKAKIAILEKEPKIGLHASGRNSGVLHSGIYYTENTLKAQICSRGAHKMAEFASIHKIAYKKVGKVIIASDSHDLPTLDSLLQNATKNKIEAYSLDAQEIKKIEPFATPFERGIFTPSTAIIDSKTVLKTLEKILIERGVTLFFNNEVKNFNKQTRTLITSSEKFNYDYLFNCAGSSTDSIAKMYGLAQQYRLLPFKGIYFQLKPKNAHWVNSNIYPAPNLNLPFLGVHFTRTIDGNVYVGPTAIPAFGRENYGLLSGINLEAFRIAKDIMLMYAANQQNFRMLLHTEVKKYIKSYFIKTAKKLISSIEAEDLIRSNKVGIRPQLINVVQKRIEMDYILENDSHSIHVLNAISPAFTGAFAFAELLVNRMNTSSLSTKVTQMSQETA